MARAAGVWTLILFGALLSTSAHAQPAASSGSLRAILRGEAALADLDGDRRPDSAVAESTPSADGHGYRVTVQLSGNPGHAFDVPSRVPGGLRVTPLDVDGDHDLDLVITTERGRHPVGVWVNDGNGAFSQDLVTEYSASIWQQPDTWFESPAQADTRTWDLPVPPTADRAPPAVTAGFLPRPARRPAGAVIARPRFLLGHSSGPLRAPPLA